MTIIQWTGRATKDLLSLPSNDKEAISAKVNAMESYPDLTGLDVIKLTDQKGKYRLRVKSYRVLFELVNGKTKVIEIQRILRRTSTTY